MVKLSDVSRLQFGYYAKPEEEGDVMYLQARNFDQYGDLSIRPDTWLKVTGKSEGHLLQDGDVLFVGKGMRNFAWTYREELGRAIASSIFFVIRPDKNKVIPEYLASLFNIPKYQSYFQTLGAGSSIPSIRKNELEEVELPLPLLPTQKQIVEINQLHKEELAMAEKIIAVKKKLFQQVVNNIIANNYGA